MAKLEPKRIAIIGGSFNPVHNGHVNMIRYLLKESIVESVIVMPAFIAPHKQMQFDPGYRHRLHMLKLALPDKSVKISVLEKQLGETSYTYNTIVALGSICPKTVFSLVLGWDMYLTFDSWYKSLELKKLVQLLVFRRDSIDVSGTKGFKVPPLFIENQLWKISSTQIREALLADDRQTAKDHLPKAVFDYILQRKLYCN